MLNVVQDAAPDGELRRPVTDTATLKRGLVIFKAVLHQPRLQTPKWALTEPTQWSNTRLGGNSGRIAIRIDQSSPATRRPGSTK